MGLRSLWFKHSANRQIRTYSMEYVLFHLLERNKKCALHIPMEHAYSGSIRVSGNGIGIECE